MKKLITHSGGREEKKENKSRTYFTPQRSIILYDIVDQILLYYLKYFLAHSSDAATVGSHYNVAELREMIMLLIPDVGISVEGVGA